MTTYHGQVVEYSLSSGPRELPEEDCNVGEQHDGKDCPEPVGAIVGDRVGGRRRVVAEDFVCHDGGGVW
jgi:hypothetical protein